MPQRRRLEQARKARSKGGGHGVKSSRLMHSAWKARRFPRVAGSSTAALYMSRRACCAASLTTLNRHGSIRAPASVFATALTRVLKLLGPNSERRLKRRKNHDQRQDDIDRPSRLPDRDVQGADDLQPVLRKGRDRRGRRAHGRQGGGLCASV